MPRLLRFPLSSVVAWAAVVEGVLGANGVPRVAAQVIAPTPPERFTATINYQTRTDQEGRLRDYREFLDALTALGFEPTDAEAADRDRFDVTSNRLVGTLPREGALQLPANPFVQGVVLIPADMELPTDPAERVEIRLELATGLGAEQQRILHKQTAALLAKLDVQQHPGYDHAGFTRFRGVGPASVLTKLLDDLRTQPSGWFLPETPLDELPLPIRTIQPVRLTTVLPARPAVTTAPAGPELPDALAPVAGKLSPELRRVLANADTEPQPLRMELVLAELPPEAVGQIRERLNSVVSGVQIHGAYGNILAIQAATREELAAVLALPEVQSARLARAADGAVTRAEETAAVTPAHWLRSTRLMDLHAAGFRGEGVTVVVVATDFAGADSLIGSGLPKQTRIVDLTAELRADVTPAPTPPEAPQNGPSNGTQLARLVAQAAPDANLVLVRVDAAAPYQVLTVARAAVGEPGASDAVLTRAAEQARERERLGFKRNIVSTEYGRALQDLAAEGSAERLQKARAAFDQLRAEEATLTAAADRLAALQTSLDGLRGTGVVLNTLVWSAAAPQDGLSTLSRYLELNLAPRPDRSSRRRAETRPPVPVWVQVASPLAGRVWAGLLRDTDDNRLVEFVPLTSAVPPKLWTRELNFLTLGTSPAADTVAELPAGVRVQFTVQWREPAGVAGLPGDNAALRFVPRLVRQLDPTGRTFATDEFVPIPMQVSQPIRLLRTSAAAAFEVIAEATLPTAGVYALQLEAGAADSRLPGLRQQFEVNPRVVVDGATDAGAITFKTFATAASGVGSPADSPAALTVGTESAGQNLTGGGPGIVLRSKPDYVAPGTVRLGENTLTGPGAAAALVAGGAACLKQLGVTASDLLRVSELSPGQPFVLPQPVLDAAFTRQRR